jgi:Na+-driven multidrug efflux pump
MGRMGVTIVLTGIQITLRTVFTYLLAPAMGIRGIAVACAAGWTAMLIAAFILYRRTVRETGLSKTAA